MRHQSLKTGYFDLLGFSKDLKEMLRRRETLGGSALCIVHGLVLGLFQANFFKE